MENRESEIFDEVNPLLTQHRREVPGGRRSWPESIKARVLELRRLGLNYREIARRTAVPGGVMNARSRHSSRWP
jgi:hypothetical protein